MIKNQNWIYYGTNFLSRIILNPNYRRFYIWLCCGNVIIPISIKFATINFIIIATVKVHATPRGTIPKRSKNKSNDPLSLAVSFRVIDRTEIGNRNIIPGHQRQILKRPCKHNPTLVITFIYPHSIIVILSYRWWTRSHTRVHNHCNLPIVFRSVYQLHPRVKECPDVTGKRREILLSTR